MTGLQITAQTIEECYQFESIIKYLENDSTASDYFKVKNVRFKINPKVDKNKGTPFLITEYYSEKLDLSEEQLKSDTSILYSVYRKNQDYLLKTDSTFNLACLQNLNTKRPNVYMGFSRLDSFAISVGTSKILKQKRKHTFGKYYIFLFDKENIIRRILQTDWIE
ncbi:hypothetical protein KFZ70_00490 [Tamlana fucoidanivorans]|uniref:Uncharacterized protein n=1 Tax=Allotamlana fucoidanivorans TaxID=2583814 RepID=A0A5C4SF50_9FLAO|nr:hypothetical protein [Tamlana fucoidanivorans]TNJ41332.1 hypothetical protein FGF67_16205 [Tamlana fucoidanivorans]